MKHQRICIAALCIMGTIFAAGIADATPSTIIWIPSVDIQGYKIFHLGIDNYALDYKSGKMGSGSMYPTDLGLTVGILPTTKIQAEVGVDYFTPQRPPFSLNAKVGVPEGAVAGWSPAIAIGIYGVGFQKNVTDYNIVYGMTARTLPVIGRLEAGFYTGNKHLLRDAGTGTEEQSGILFSWDRQMTEISDKLWLAVDYQSGKNAMGAFSYGFAWTFAQNVSVIFARDVFRADVPSALTLQLDINI